MMSSKVSRAWLPKAAIVAAGASVLLASGAALAQSPQSTQVFLIRQDFSDCTNSNVPNQEGPNQWGVVSLVRGSDGNTNLKIAFTGTPNTTYHFFLKCVRLLTDITTGPEGTAEAMVSFPTNQAGNVYAFDSYPEGAPAGNKMQSGQVKW